MKILFLTSWIGINNQKGGFFKEQAKILEKNNYKIDIFSPSLISLKKINILKFKLVFLLFNTK